MRIGIIGLGRAGAVHLAACQRVSGIEVVAVCDPLPEARRVASAAGIAAYADLKRMLDRVQLEAVTICTPPAHHAASTIACLERGLHVLCEKPLAVTSAGAAEMCETARREGLQLAVASKFRHVPAVSRAREIVLGGELGEPVAATITFCSPVDMADRWNIQRRLSGGGVIIDNGCHAFDILHFLFGPVARVRATLLKPTQRLPVEDSAIVEVRTGDGVTGWVELSWSWSTGRDTYLVIQGTRGTVEVGWHGARLKVAGKDWREIGGSYNKLDAHGRMHVCFKNAVFDGAESWIQPAACLRAVGTVEAAYRSLKSGTWERVESNVRPGPAEFSFNRAVGGMS